MFKQNIKILNIYILVEDTLSRSRVVNRHININAALINFMQYQVTIRDDKFILLVEGGYCVEKKQKKFIKLSKHSNMKNFNQIK